MVAKRQSPGNYSDGYSSSGPIVCERVSILLVFMKWDDFLHLSFSQSFAAFGRILYFFLLSFLSESGISQPCHANCARFILESILFTRS